MSTSRLVKITDNVWVDPFEVIAVNAEQSFGGTRIHLRSGDSVHTRNTVAEVLGALRGQQ